MKWPARINDWLSKHPLIFIFLLVGYIFLDKLPGLIAVFQKAETITISQKIDQSQGKTEGKETVNNEQKIVCRTEDLQTNRNKWDTNNLKERSGGLWCPKEGWTDPVMWYQSGIKPSFKSLEVQYMIVKGKTSNPPSFILAFGNNKPIFKLWVPEGENLQLFRFSWNQNLDGNELTPDLAEALPDPVKPGRPDTIKIEQGAVSGNEVTFNITYLYTSSLSNVGTRGIFPKKVRMLDSDVVASAAKYPFGIGTYFGNCLSQISYTICE